MSECGLEAIEVDTFRDLVNLKWLDLSNNRIKVIQPNTFRGLSLRHLFINGNRQLQLGPESFEGLVTNGLYLHDCSLTELQPEVLAPLNSTLGYLWLNGNTLETLNRRFLPIFNTLSHLRLGSNPLHCNCEVVWLKEFYDKNSGVFEGAVVPSCLTPQRLKGKFFSELSLFDLRCQAPVFNNIDALFDVSHGRLRCTATGDPAPTLYWIQPRGRTTKYLAPEQEDARRNTGELDLSLADVNDLSGMYICVAKNEAGNVTLTINVTLPHPRASGDVTYKTLGVGPELDSTPGPGTPQQGQGSTLVLLPTPSTIEAADTASTSRPRDQRGTYVQAKIPDPEKNRTLHSIQTDELPHRTGERMFSVVELIGAVVGTHVCTLLLCLIFMPIYYRRKLRQQQCAATTLEKKAASLPPEAVYLNGMGRHPVTYLDSLKGGVPKR